MRARGRALSSCRPFGAIVTRCLSVPEQWRTAPGIVRTSEILAITGLARDTISSALGAAASLFFLRPCNTNTRVYESVPLRVRPRRDVFLSPEMYSPRPSALATLSERERARDQEVFRSKNIVRGEFTCRDCANGPRDVNRLEMSLLSRVVPREKFADETRRRRKMGWMSTLLCSLAAVRCRLMASRCLSARLRSVSLSLSLSRIVFAIFVKRVARSILEKETWI